MDFLSEFEKNIGYEFNDRMILKQALTHSSYMAEGTTCRSNERLEYLGDAVLELLVTHTLYQTYPNYREGQMTKIRAAVVSEAPLASIAREINLGKALLLGRGTDKSGGRKLNSILSDALEAVIGAIYLDGGFEASRNFILPYLDEKIKHAAENGFSSDYKTRLQEFLQRKGSVNIIYEIIGESGPPHDKQFIAQVTVDKEVLAKGQGKSKKVAHQQAAKAALEKVQPKG